jgi:chemotaxis protein MotB
LSKNNDEKQPIIIIKKVKKVDGGHHGGAWKVAYADFVTAMMAFFLLLWLLNVTTDEQKELISSYFAPADPRVAETMSGSGGVMGGTTLSSQGALTQQNNPVNA